MYVLQHSKHTLSASQIANCTDTALTDPIDCTEWVIGGFGVDTVTLVGEECVGPYFTESGVPQEICLWGSLGTLEDTINNEWTTWARDTANNRSYYKSTDSEHFIWIDSVIGQTTTWVLGDVVLDSSYVAYCQANSTTIDVCDTWYLNETTIFTLDSNVQLSGDACPYVGDNLCVYDSPELCCF